MEKVVPIWLNDLQIPLKKLQSRIDQYFDWLHSDEQDTGGIYGFTREYVARFIQEATAYVKCIEAGAEVAASHHSRLIVESLAGLSFVVSDMKCNPGSIDKKLEMWKIFPKIKTYRYFQALLNRLDAKQLTEEQLRSEYGLERAQVEYGATQYSEHTKEQWRQLFELAKTDRNGRDISLYEAFKQIDYWHYPKGLADLMDHEIPKALQECVPRSDSEKYRGWHESYRNLSNLTHPNHFATQVMASGQAWSLKIDSRRYSVVQVTTDFIELVGKISWLMIPDTVRKPSPTSQGGR